jgi:hypothetical protein
MSRATLRDILYCALMGAALALYFTLGATV